MQKTQKVFPLECFAIHDSLAMSKFYKLKENTQWLNTSYVVYMYKYSICIREPSKKDYTGLYPKTRPFHPLTTDFGIIQ